MTTYQTDRIYVFRLPPGVDLIEGLTDYCRQAGIGQAILSGIGAVKHVEIAHFSFAAQEYHRMRFEDELELLALNGNVSLRDGGLFVHAHVVLGDREGHAWGGHCFAAEVLVAEITLHGLAGQPLERVLDPRLGLKLWPTE